MLVPGMNHKPPIGPNTRLCMSLSARPSYFGSCFHNRLYALLGLDFVYKAFKTTDLEGVVRGIRALEIRGCAISMPFKEAVIPLLDQLAASATAIESVNTIVNDGTMLTGYNTDYGAIVTLLDKAGIAPSTPFLLRGAGGMAKAVAAALRDRGHKTGTIIASNKIKGPALAALYGFDWAPDCGARNASLLINATPLGMTGPEAEALAFSHAQIQAAETVFDVVALPAETPLLRAARNAKRQTITGAEVGVLQAVEQFVLYTGLRPSDDQIAQAAAYAAAMRDAHTERLIF